MKVLVNNANLTYKDVFKKTDYEVWEQKEKRYQNIMDWISAIGGAFIFLGMFLFVIFFTAMI